MLMPDACCTVHLRVQLNQAGAVAWLETPNWVVVLVTVYGTRERNRCLGPSDSGTVRANGPLLDRKNWICSVRSLFHSLNSRKNKLTSGKLAAGTISAAPCLSENVWVSLPCSPLCFTSSLWTCASGFFFCYALCVLASRSKLQMVVQDVQFWSRWIVCMHTFQLPQHITWTLGSEFLNGFKFRFLLDLHRNIRQSVPKCTSFFLLKII